MHEPLSLFNHHKQCLTIVNLLSMVKIGSSLTISISLHGMNGILPESSIYTWSLLYIHIELVNCMITYQFSQNSLKILICKRSCDTIRIEESSLQRKETPLYWTKNLLLKRNILPQQRQWYNIYLNRLFLTSVPQILDLQL